MQTADFRIPQLSGGALAVDLECTLMAANGVGSVRVDGPAGRISVEYDPDYTDETVLERLIRGAGYPVLDGTGAGSGGNGGDGGPGRTS
jgi:hypothetical protein